MKIWKEVSKGLKSTGGEVVGYLDGLQGGLPPLDFSGLKGRKRKEYFAAIRMGLDGDYKAMEAIFNDVILKTLRKRKA